MTGSGADVVTISEVGPRDGLQSEARCLPPEVRAELVGRLTATGITRVEAVSFVNPARVPQMAEPEQVLARIERKPAVTYSALVLNRKGYERLLAAPPIDQVNLSVAATESFSLRNAGLSRDDALAHAADILSRRQAAGLRASAGIAVAFGCPFDGRVPVGAVVALAGRLVESGADELVLGDTIGVAVPEQVRSLVREVHLFGVPVAIHPHNTRNTGFANVVAALEAGASIVDASIGGTGGCPTAPGASGNIATEDLVYLLEGQGVRTGINLDALIEVACWLERMLGHRLDGHVYRAPRFPAGASA